MPTRRRRPVGRRPRRKLVWSRLQFDTTLTNALPGFIINLTEPLETDMGAQLIGCTVMRIRGSYSVLDSGGTNDDTPITVVAAIRRGASTITNGAVAPGAQLSSEFPLGIPGRHNDWMLYQPTIIYDSGAGDLAVAREHVDVKSMRKIDELGESLGLFLQATPAAGETVRITGVFSLLVALP